MAFNEQAAQFLHIPPLNLKGYETNHNLSYSKNKKGLKKFLREKERNQLKRQLGKEYEGYPSKITKEMGMFIGVVFIVFPSCAIIMSGFFAGLAFTIPIGCLLFGGYVTLMWELHFWKTVSKDESHEKLMLFFETYWMELLMRPNLAKILEKIYQTETKLNELKKHCIGVVEISEEPSIHPDNLVEAEGGVVVLDIHIELQEVALEFYRALDQAFFAVKTSKEQSEEVQKALSVVGEGKPIEKEKFLKRISQLDSILLEAEKIKINTKSPQSATAEYERLLALIEKCI